MTDTLPLSIQPVISYPKEAEVGKTYLMEIDLQMPESGFEWQYEEEEYLIYCMVNAGNLFTVTSVGEPAIVLHRFGGTYGNAKFLLEADIEEKSGSLSVFFVNQWGKPIRSVNCEVTLQKVNPSQGLPIISFIHKSSTPQFPQYKDLIRNAVRTKSISLDLSSQNLKTFPDEIFNLPNLQELNLSSNQITRIPEAIASLSNLRVLNLSDNQIIEIPEVISILANLQELNFSSNQITRILSAIGNLSNLRVLNLSGNQIIEIPEVISILGNLQELNLSSNQITWIPSAIANLSNLQRLDLRSNQIIEIPEILESIVSLKKLDLRGNTLPIPPEIVDSQDAQGIFSYLVQIRNNIRPLNEVQLTADDLFDQAYNNIERLGLREIPFTESPIELQSETLQRIFTGRENELRHIFNLFQSRDRRRILIYGRIGIGKSAFLLEVLSVLRRKKKQMLTTYVSLPANLDLATTALIALARAMPDDDWAQQQLSQMGIPTTMILKERSSKVGGTLVFTDEVSEKNFPTTKPQHPTANLEILLERAQKKYSDGVLIVIDDLDKQDPSTVRKLIHDARGMLKGRAWFMLTGHPMGMTGDLLTSERGLFDLQLKLAELDQPTTYKMLINYLNSARIKNDCTDPNDPRSVLPFLPETAKKFCEVSFGKPSLFNRLGSIVLSTATDLHAETITPEVLEKGLEAASRSLPLQATLSFQEERVRALLLARGGLSNETVLMEDLQQLGFRTFSELLPILERLEEADLVYQMNQDGTKTFEPILLLSADEKLLLDKPE